MHVNVLHYLFPQLEHPPVCPVYKTSFMAVYIRKRACAAACVCGGGFLRVLDVLDVDCLGCALLEKCIEKCEFFISILCIVHR